MTHPYIGNIFFGGSEGQASHVDAMAGAFIAADRPQSPWASLITIGVAGTPSHATSADPMIASAAAT